MDYAYKDNFFTGFIRLVLVVWDFCPWDVMTKVRYFLMVQIYNFRTLEVEHDLETCQRPWYMYLNFDLMGVSRAQKLKVKHWKIMYFRHYVPWMKIPDDMNKVILGEVFFGFYKKSY